MQVGPLIFASVISIGGVELPWWAWSIAISAAVADVIFSDVGQAFWRGLTGQ